jgi:hypothetical protein
MRAKRGAVQFHCDFTHLLGNKRSQLGIVVVEDIKHKAWPVSFIVSPPESIEWATAVMEVTVDLINNNPNAKLDKALIDGAAALKNAANSLGVTARSCFTHIARLPNGTKKNGKRGTKGSLCNYLSTGTKDSTEKHLSLKDSVKVILFLLLFHFSCTTIIEVEERNTNIYSVSLNSIFSKLILDLQFAVVTTRDKTGIIDVCDVIGDSMASFTLNIPTASTVYSHVCQQDDLQRSSVAVASYSEQRSNRHCGGDIISTPKQACILLKDYCRNMMKTLYQNLARDCLANTPGCKTGETFWSFVHRRCQRNPESGSTIHTARRLKEQKKAISKQNRANREAAERVHLDKLKYSEKPTAEDVINKCSESIITDGNEQWLDNDGGEEMIQLLTELDFDLEGDIMLNSLMDESNRITLKRQLGSWIEVEVDGLKRRVTCNCEDYNFHYLCVHQVTLEVLQFGRLPSNKCSKHHENWNDIRAESIRYLKRTSLCDHNDL